MARQARLRGLARPAPETRRYRRRMVARHIATRGVHDQRVLAALAWAPREWFVPPHLEGQAYSDGPLPIGNAQTISQPYVTALMTALLALRRADRVLEIGTGSGYQTAVLAHLAEAVFTIERLPDLLVEAEARFDRLGLGAVRTRLGDGAVGWPEEAPFDAIVVTAAAPHVPAPLTSQLAVGGRLVIPLGDLAEQDLVVLRKTTTGFVERRMSGVRFVPLISREAFSDPGWR